MNKATPTDHPVHDLIARRWSPRAYSPETVPAEALRSILEAARWAASAFNEQPWSFLVARRENEAEFETMLGCLVEGNQGWARNAGVPDPDGGPRGLLAQRQTEPPRLARRRQAAANLSLQATALGFVAHQMAGIVPDRAREIYGIPEGHDVVTAIAVGRQGDAGDLPDPLREMETAPRQRKPQADFVFSGSWGNAVEG